MNKQIYEWQIWSAVKVRPESSNFTRYALWVIIIHAVVFAIAFLIK